MLRRLPTVPGLLRGKVHLFPTTWYQLRHTSIIGYLQLSLAIAPKKSKRTKIIMIIKKIKKIAEQRVPRLQKRRLITVASYRSLFASISSLLFSQVIAYSDLLSYTFQFQTRGRHSMMARSEGATSVPLWWKPAPAPWNYEPI